MERHFEGEEICALIKECVFNGYHATQHFFTIITQSHNFGKGFFVKLVICHLPCKATLSRRTHATCMSL